MLLLTILFKVIEVVRTRCATRASIRFMYGYLTIRALRVPYVTGHVTFTKISCRQSMKNVNPGIHVNNFRLCDKHRELLNSKK